MTITIPQTSRRDRSLVAMSGTTTLACRRYATYTYRSHTYGMQAGGIMAFSTELCIPNGIHIAMIKRHLPNFVISSVAETSYSSPSFRHCIKGIDVSIQLRNLESDTMAIMAVISSGLYEICSRNLCLCFCSCS